MSTNQPTNKPEDKPAQSPKPSTNLDKAGLKPQPGTAKPDSDPKRKTDKTERKKFPK